MRGVSEVIAIILILMITIAIVGLAYTFMSSTMSSTTSAASSAVDETTSNMKTSFVIESVDMNRVYVRNNGQTVLSSFSAYVNDNLVDYNAASISPGDLGIITILGKNLFKGDMIKISSLTGFNAEKLVSTAYYDAVGYWKLDDGSGSIAADYSGNGNVGNLISMNTVGNSTSGWTYGKYGNALIFDGIDDKVVLGDDGFDGMTQLTISGWMNIISEADWEFVFGKANYDGWGPYFMQFSNNPTPERRVSFYISNLTTRVAISSNGGIPMNTWTHFACVYNGTSVVMYINSTRQNAIQYLTGSVNNTNHNFAIGSPSNNAGFFNGILDDIAIWNRSLSSDEILQIYNKAIY